MIKDIIFLLKNGYIVKKIPILMNYEMLKKDYIEKHREIIWTLLVEYCYLIYDYRTVTAKFDFKVVKHPPLLCSIERK
ncbi:hypothetical protein LY90DRAFT_708636 [Neocallimastix californiae]|uniref:Uncharacterized protein n=1 Tax=Neocallimastix californiae TaxID=1754190 RepID=A0A1Y1ZTU3_9FUNG|nr:hypothetical protein LY90DRAFT_708636 [Neocallimastix californiae]|eukprot:ORY13651.1 hypothetical protein LY90DRAFT_708636 [Neocallimastix californiae]